MEKSNPSPLEPISWTEIQNCPADSPEQLAYRSIILGIAASLKVRPEMVLWAVYVSLIPELGENRKAHSKPRNWSEYPGYLRKIAERKIASSYKAPPHPKMRSHDEPIPGTDGVTFGDILEAPCPHAVSEEQATARMTDLLDDTISRSSKEKEAAIARMAKERLQDRKPDLTQEEMGRIAGCDQSTVGRRLKRFAEEYHNRYDR